MNKYLEFPSTMAINGHCGAGKSHCIKEIVSSTKNNWSYIMVVSNTAQFNDDYTYLKKLRIPHKLFGSTDYEASLEKLMEIQKTTKENQVLVIFDDVMGSIKDGKLLKQLVTTYRHYRISLIFSSQSITGVATYLREICQYVIIFKQRSKRALTTCYEAYFQDVDTFTKFKRLFSGLKQYHFYFIDRKKNKRYILTIK
jgi:hypothetical protein